MLDVMLLKTDQDANNVTPNTATNEDVKMNTPFISIPQIVIKIANK